MQLKKVIQTNSEGFHCKEKEIREFHKDKAIFGLNPLTEEENPNTIKK